MYFATDSEFYIYSRRSRHSDSRSSKKKKKKIISQAKILKKLSALYKEHDGR